MSKHTRDDEKSGVLTFLLIAAVIAIIGMALWGGNEYFKDKNQNKADDGNKTKNNVTVQQNNVVENVVENVTTENTVEENTVTENTVKKPDDNTEAKEEMSISDEDKALKLAKEKYGTSDGVYFRIEQPLNNGIFDVSVRDSKTTTAIRWYRVNIKTGTVE